MARQWKTFEWRRGGAAFIVEQVDYTFLGTTRTIDQVKMTPAIEQAVRVEQGSNYLEGIVRFDKDES